MAGPPTPPASAVRPAGVPRFGSRWARIALLLFLIYLVAFADRTNISVAVPAIAVQFGLGATVTGVLLSAFFWGYITTMVPGGWLAERIGPTRVVTVAATLLGLATMACALATGLGELITLRVVMGFAEGALFPAFTVLYLRWFPAGERGQAVNSCELAIPLATIVSAPLAGWLIDSLGWPSMFLGQGAPMLLLAALFGLLGSDAPERDRRIGPAERDHILATRGTQTARDGRFTDVLRAPRVWLQCVVYFGWMCGLYGFGLWLPSTLKAMSGRSIGVVGWLSAVPYAVALVCMYFAARWSDRSPRSRAVFVVVPVFVAGVALLLGHYLQLGLTAQFVLLVLACTGIYTGLGPWWTWSIEQSPRNQAGAAVGLINISGSLGGIAGPVIVGAASSGSDQVSGLYLLGFGTLAAALLLTIAALRRGQPVPAVPALGEHR